jgi:hypothetical protein
MALSAQGFKLRRSEIFVEESAGKKTAESRRGRQLAGVSDRQFESQLRIALHLQSS